MLHAVSGSRGQAIRRLPVYLWGLWALWLVGLALLLLAGSPLISDQGLLGLAAEGVTLGALLAATRLVVRNSALPAPPGSSFAANAALGDLPLFMGRVDAAGRVVAVQAASPRIVRSPFRLTPTTTLLDILPEHTAHQLVTALQQVSAARPVSGVFEVEAGGSTFYRSYRIALRPGVDAGNLYDLLIHDVGHADTPQPAHLHLLEEERQQRIEAEANAILFRQFLNSTPAGVAIFDVEMRYVAYSQRWLTDYNLPPDESLVGRSHYEVFPDIPERWRKIHQRCLQGETLSCDDDEFVRADGSVDWVRWEIEPWYQAGGQIGGIVMFTEVITEDHLLRDEIHTLLKGEHEERLIAETLNQVIISLLSHDSQATVMDEILQQIARIVPYDLATLAQVDDDRLTLLACQSGKDTVETDVRQGLEHINVQESPSFRISIKQQEPVLIPDSWADSDWQYVEEFAWVRSHISFPIVFKNQLLGLLLLDAGQPDRFSAADLDRLRPLIRAVAIILQNIRLYEQSREELRQRRQAERALQHANEVLAQRVSERTAELEAEVLERRRTENLLRDSEERFRSAFTGAPIGLAIIDLDGRFLQVNHVLCEILNQSEVQLLSASFGQTPDQDVPISAEAIRHLAASGGTVQYEKIYRRPDNERVWLIISGSYIHNELGKPEYIVAQIQDVTARKQAEQENIRLLKVLRHRNTQLRTAAAVSTTAASILDPQELITEAVNLIREQFQFYYVGLFMEDEAGKYAVLRAGTGEAGQKMVEDGHRLELGGNSMIGQCMALNMPRIALDVQSATKRFVNPRLPETRSEMALPLSTPSSGCIGGLTVHSTAENAFSQEDIAALQSMAEQIAIALENARLYNAAQEEITRRLEAEFALKDLNEDLERLVRERTAELTAANKELEAFAYSISHDLRAPARRLKGFAQAIMEDYASCLDDDGRDYLHRMRAASQHMNDLIDSMLALSLVTRTALHREEVNLSEIATSICDSLAEQEPDRKVYFMVEPDLIVNGDPRLLTNVLDNLISNAWKFTSRKEQAEITVGAVIQPENTVYFVRDNGAGFDMAYAEELFTPFHRLHTEADYDGSGIGLATVQRIIHRHGGRVWAEGKPDEGATVFFVL